MKNKTEKIIAKVRFKNNLVHSNFEKVLVSASYHAAEKLCKALYQNGHKVISSKIGESRSGGYRRKVIFIDAENLNGKIIHYKVAFSQDGDEVYQIGSCISHGWQPVITWN